MTEGEVTQYTINILYNELSQHIALVDEELKCKLFTALH